MKSINDNKLVDLIQLVPNERKFICSKNEHWTFGDLKTEIIKFKQKHEELVGSRCAIRTSDRKSLAVSLPCIENLVSAIFIQPSDLSEENQNDFYLKANITHVIDINDLTLEIKQLEGSSKKFKSNNGSVEWIMATSGTTGIPKLISYELKSLLAASKANLVRGKEFNWGLCYDLNRFAGLQVYFLTLSSGSRLVVSEYDDSVQSMLNLFCHYEVNALSATPSMWRKILMASESSGLNFKQITLGGEIADQAVLSALNAKYPYAKIVHIYASTEAGVGFAVKDAKAGFPLDYIETDILGKTKLKIAKNNLWIKSNKGASKILCGTVEVDSQGYLDTGDIVTIKNNRVMFLGRDSGSINVGGNKVLPEEVECVLNQLSQITLSRVYGKANPIMGMLVNADVVLANDHENEDHKELKKIIKVECNRFLADFKVPAVIKFVKTIPVNSTGKILRC